MKLILLGAPGSGKGTQAAILGKRLSIPTISTGDIFRDAMKKGTETGLKAKAYMDAGKLVPDEIVLGIVRERLVQDDCKNGFILDGFPRTIPQAEALEGIVSIDFALSLEVPDSAIEMRMAGRRVCRGCGKTYNIQANPSRIEGICDDCGGELITRADDNLETVRTRLSVYHRESEPLKGFYEGRGKLRLVVNPDGMEKTAGLILEAIGIGV